MNKDALEQVSNFYEVKKDYDYINTKLAFKIFKDDIIDKNVLEVGCADGVMTEMLVKQTKSLEIVEPSKRYCDIVRKIEGVNKVYNCFLEEIEIEKKYDVILLASLIHHIEKPNNLLLTIKKFMHKDSIVLATVPNVKSLHRRIGVKMGLLENEFDSSLRNKQLHQYGRYDINKFKQLFISSDFNVIDNFGYMIKPFSSKMMEKIHLDDNQIQAMFEIGKEFPELSSQIYLKAGV